jgi:hypothetical protein
VKVANEDLGTIACPVCGCDALIRKNRKLKHYVFCPTNCKIVSVTGPAGSDILAGKAHFYGDPTAQDPLPVSEPIPEPVSEPEPVPIPEPEQKEVDDLDDWLS